MQFNWKKNTTYLQHTDASLGDTFLLDGAADDRLIYRIPVYTALTAHDCQISSWTIETCMGTHSCSHSHPSR